MNSQGRSMLQDRLKQVLSARCIQLANRCQVCGSNNGITFLHYGSYCLTCADCKSNIWATSYISILMKHAEDVIELIEINADLNEIGEPFVGKRRALQQMLGKQLSAGKRYKITGRIASTAGPESAKVDA